MLQLDFSEILLLIAIISLVIYRISFFRKRSIGYFSALQFMYLVVIPGIIYVLSFLYLQNVISRPLVQQTLLPDKFLISAFLLAQLFTYGGLAIHAVTKMLYEHLKYETTSAAKLNKYFHLTFSHSLIYSGAVAMILFLPLIELNHLPTEKEYGILLSIVIGTLFALSLIMAMYWYTRSSDSYFGKWSDLKTVFLLTWIGLLVILWAIGKTDPNLKDYQFLIPVLTGFVVLSSFNVFFILRRIKRGGFRIYVRYGRQEQRLVEVTQPIVSPSNKQSPTK